MASTPHHDAENPPKNFDSKGQATFKPRQLNIVWGEDPRYWRMPKDKEEAELLQVCWLEVSGNISSNEKGNKYKISFTVELKSDAFGWSNCPVYVMAKYGKKGKYSWVKYHLQDSKGTKELTLNISPPKDHKEDDDIFFGLYEVWSGKWKGGLLLHSAVVENLGK